MKNWYRRWHYCGLLLAASGLFALGGCGLSDQQLAPIWESVIESGLNTLVTTALTQATG
jgi:high-affinity Fe2+/Pb2+ permease